MISTRPYLRQSKRRLTASVKSNSEAKMTSTIVGIFEDQREAEEVAKDLKHEGFSESDIHLVDQAGREHQGWFRRLFGRHEERDTLAYREALRTGKAVVAVDTDEEQIEQAADIMERHRPIDIE